MENRLGDVEEDIKTEQTARLAIATKLDQLDRRLFAGICLIIGAVVGARVISPDQIEALKHLLP